MLVYLPLRPFQVTRLRCPDGPLSTKVKYAQWEASQQDCSGA